MCDLKHIVDHSQYDNLRKDNANDTEDSDVVSNSFSFVPYYNLKFMNLSIIFTQFPINQSPMDYFMN